MKRQSDILRIILGFVFFFSGLAKCLNPFGFSVKAMEYVSAMGIDSVNFLQPILGVGIPALEILLSLFLLFRIIVRPTAITTLCLLSVFTLLTFWDLLLDPVGDCGCFGDVIKLSPTLSFVKNIVLLFIAIWYMRVCYSPECTNKPLLYSRILSFALCSLVFPTLVYRHLPLYDVSGYTAGTVLYDDAGSDSIDLIYKNRFTGELCSFTIEDSEWQDSTVWEFVGLKEAEDSHEVSSMSFPMLRDDFTDVSADVLSSSDSLLLVIIQDKTFIPAMQETGIRTIAISAYDLPQVSVEYYSSDFSLLRQIMPNSRGGALLVCKGVILDKWAMCDCPYFKKK